MNLKIKTLLLPFYFGSLDDNNRLLVERELLTDSEILVEYLDLKRGLESAQVIPQAPSQALWNRLQENFPSRRKFVLSLSFGAMAAAAVLLFMFFSSPQSVDVKPNEPNKEILLDLRGEPSSHSNVL